MIRILVLLSDSSIVLSTNDVLSTSQGLLLMGTVFLLAGLFVAYSQGKPAFSRARQYLSADLFSGNPTNAGNPVVVEGQIEPIEETVQGPVTGEECVIYEDKEEVFKRDYRYDTDRRREMKRSSMHSDEDAEEKRTTWHTTSSTEGYVPFYIETDHGRVAVEPDGARLDLPTRAVDQPSLFRRLLYSSRFTASFGRLFGTSPERHIENHIKPGEDVEVIGYPAVEDEQGDTVAEIKDSDDPFVVTTRSKTSLILRNITKAIAKSLPGFIFIILGSIFILGAIVTSSIL